MTRAHCRTGACLGGALLLVLGGCDPTEPYPPPGGELRAQFRGVLSADVTGTATFGPSGHPKSLRITSTVRSQGIDYLQLRFLGEVQLPDGSYSWLQDLPPGTWPVKGFTATTSTDEGHFGAGEGVFRVRRFTGDVLDVSFSLTAFKYEQPMPREFTAGTPSIEVKGHFVAIKESEVIELY